MGQIKCFWLANYLGFDLIIEVADAVQMDVGYLIARTVGGVASKEETLLEEGDNIIRLAMGMTVYCITSL